MPDLTQLLLTSTLAALLAFAVLAIPLILMFAGQLRPWFLQMAADRAASPEAIAVPSAPLARRNAPRSPSRARKVAVSKSSSTKKPASKVAKKKVAKKAASATKKAATTTTKKKSEAKPATATKKPAAKKAAKKKAAKKAAPKKAPAGAKVDPVLGVIFSKKPSDADDLKKISGVAKVLEGKLHAEGVYTYQQIADWTPAQMDAFGERLSFKNRIQRDDWKSQATALNKAKQA